MGVSEGGEAGRQTRSKKVISKTETTNNLLKCTRVGYRERGSRACMTLAQEVDQAPSVPTPQGLALSSL